MPFDEDDDLLPFDAELEGEEAGALADEDDDDALGLDDVAGLDDEAAGADAAPEFAEDSGAADAVGADGLLPDEPLLLELDGLEAELEGAGVDAAACCFFHVA